MQRRNCGDEKMATLPCSDCACQKRRQTGIACNNTFYNSSWNCRCFLLAFRAWRTTTKRELACNHRNDTSLMPLLWMMMMMMGLDLNYSHHATAETERMRRRRRRSWPDFYYFHCYLAKLVSSFYYHPLLLLRALLLLPLSPFPNNCNNTRRCSLIYSNYHCYSLPPTTSLLRHYSACRTSPNNYLPLIAPHC